MIDKVRTRYWGRQVDDVMTEIARQAAICKIRLLDPGIIDAVLQNNETASGSANPRAFKKLRDLLMLGFVMKGKSVETLGPVETAELVEVIRDRLKEHHGGRLGGAG